MRHCCRECSNTIMSLCRFCCLNFTDLITISFEMAYGKSLLKSVKMKTQSGPVLYTNLLGLVPMLFFATVGGEFGKLNKMREETTLLTGTAVLLLALGSIAGTGIGYSSWWYVSNIILCAFLILWKVLCKLCYRISFCRHV